MSSKTIPIWPFLLWRRADRRFVAFTTLLSRVDGKENLLKTMQYFAKILEERWAASGAKVLKDRAKSFRSACSDTRRIMRAFAALTCLPDLMDSISSFFVASTLEDRIVNALSSIATVCDILDYSTDNAGMLEEKGLLLLPGGVDLWDRINAFVWSLSSAIALFFALHRISHPVDRSEKKAEQDSSERSRAWLQVVYLTSEIVMAQSFAWPAFMTRNASWAPTLVGIAGTVNGLAGLVRAWPQTSLSVT
jgi:hypothetical protein